MSEQRTPAWMHLSEAPLEDEVRRTVLSDHDMYLTLTVNNLNGDSLIPITYLEDRRLNLLNERANKYKIALTNISFSQDDIYMFIFSRFTFYVTLALYDDQFGANNPLTSTQQLKFVPFNTNTIQYVRTVYQITQSVNTAYLDAFNDIITQYNAGGYTPSTYSANTAYPQIPPILVYDSDLKLYFFRCNNKMNADSFNPEACLDPTLSSVANHVVMQMSVNKDLFALLKGIPSFSLTVTTPDPPNKKFAIIKVYDNTGLNAYYPSDVLYYDISQPGSSTNLAYEFNAVVVTCDHMQVRGTLLNAATNRAINLVTSAPDSSTISRNLLHPPIPYNPSVAGATDQFGQYSWEQSGEYRWVDITSTSSFNTLNFQMHLLGPDGSLIPMNLTPNQHAYITILIRKK